MTIPGFNIEDIKESLKSFDWRDAFYDPLHDHIEADTDEDRALVNQMERLVYQLQALHLSGSEGRSFVESMMQKYWKGNPMEDQVNTLFPGNISEMFKEHVISDEVLRKAQIEFDSNKYRIAYNTIPYFLEKGDVYFFKDREGAMEFSDNNISEHDNYKAIYIRSLNELLKQIPYGEALEKHLSKSTNLSIMNEKNFEYLKDNIKYHGFGDTLNAELENQLKKGTPEFSLDFKTEVNKRNMEATLYFKKSDTTDMYFFNKYDAKTTSEKNDESVAQTFYLNKGQGVTLKEAYNLLNGRAIHKELIDKQDQKYQAWIQLDFSVKDKNGNFERKQFHQNYGFDLKEALSYYPIKEMMKEGEKEKLVRSLEKGNVQMVTLETPGKDMRIFMEANPQYKSLNLYNGKMQNLDQGQRQELMQKPEVKEEGKDQKQEKNLGQEEKQESKKSAKKKPGDDLDEPKKKTSRKKGMSV